MGRVKLKPSKPRKLKPGERFELQFPEKNLWWVNNAGYATTNWIKKAYGNP